MRCGCCGHEATKLDGKSVAGLDMFVCNPCVPEGAECPKRPAKSLMKGWHFFTIETNPPRAPRPVAKKGKGK